MESPYLGRELSWLRFNARVLAQARDGGLPPLERLRFVEIFGKNLDEFFMVRVGALQERMNLGEKTADDKTGKGPGEVLDEVYQETRRLLGERDRICGELAGELRAHGIVRRRHGELGKKERRYVTEVFRRDMLPLLSPQILDARHPFPHMENLGTYIIAELKGDERSTFGVLPVPRRLDRLVRLPDGGFMLCEEVLLHHLPKVFDGYRADGKCVVRLTRSADMDVLDDQEDGGPDYAASLKKKLKKRDRLAPVRLQFYGKAKPAVKKLLMSRCGIRERQIFTEETPLSFDFAGRLIGFARPESTGCLTRPPYRPPQTQQPVGMLGRLRGGDMLLAYPYDGIAPLLRLISEAAEDESVISVKITLYRLGENSQVAAALCRAAENGKEVTVILELRARFDESSNIDWARHLEEAGCRVMYGPEGFKVHAKLLLVTARREGRLTTATYIGTGNFNEQTARQYTDFALLTARRDFGADAVRLFQNIAICNLSGEYKRLIVAPGGLKKRILEGIDGEIEKARGGGAGEIFAKINALTDRAIIDRLTDASRAGVQIRLLVRGVCCLRPGVPGLSERIEVRSIVGRFLEHSRVYWFGDRRSREVCISSADWMSRNTERRVEVAAPVRDPALRARIEDMMELMWRDNVGAWRLLPDGEYVRLRPEPGGEAVDAQDILAGGAAQALNA